MAPHEQILFTKRVMGEPRQHLSGKTLTFKTAEGEGFGPD